jgi:hypothetical protein
MKYIITESQYIKLKEDIFNSDDENNIIGNPSELTLMLADFLLRQDLVDIRRMLISDDEIEIFGFGEPILEYFMDNSISFQVIGAERDVHVNVVANDDIEGEYPEREEAFNFIRNLAEDFSFVNWYIEGDRI